MKSLEEFMSKLTALGLAYGYFPELENSTVIAAEVNHEAVRKRTGGSIGVKAGAQYVGTFLGDECKRDKWVMEQVEQWRSELQSLVVVAHREPQAAYCLFTKALSAKWTYMQRVCPGVGHLFEPLEEII